MREETQKMLNNALALAEAGWDLIPFDPVTREYLMKVGFDAGTRDFDQIRNWFIKWPLAHVMAFCPSFVAVQVRPEDDVEDYLLMLKDPDFLPTALQNEYLRRRQKRSKEARDPGVCDE